MSEQTKKSVEEIKRHLRYANEELQLAQQKAKSIPDAQLHKRLDAATKEVGDASKHIVERSG